jgi:selenocysteine lyase/cysteine desulfurase
MDVTKVRAEFPILQRKVYLNSCSLGALSLRATAYLESFQELWHELGASAWYGPWWERLGDLRSRVGRFLGAPVGQLALLPSTSAALSVVAESVDYGRRNRVVCTELDFPTLAYQWAVKPDVELVVLPSHDGISVDPEQFAAAVDDRTAFLATSHVLYTTGFIQDLNALADIAYKAGAYFLVDGYQGPGQIPVDVTASKADFYTTGPLKWLCGGPGLSYLYVRDELVQKLQPRITGWFAARDQFTFDLEHFEPQDDARRFELGTPALPTVHTALGGQEIIDEWGIEAIRSRNRALTEHLVERARESGFQLTIAPDPGDRSAIVMIKHGDPPAAVAYLAERGIIVDHRPGHVRVSPHFYNTIDEIDQCITTLAESPR